MSVAALEEDLRRQCADLERQVRQDPLTFENEALEVQLVQMQDDYTSLLEDFRSMREYFGQQIAQLTSQLEDRSRAAGTAEGHADCLRELLQFHEDQGQLAGSYWRAQCEKRDDSIRFLALKLQEYTVPSAEYRAPRDFLDADAKPSGMEPAEETTTPATATPPSSPPSQSRGIRSPIGTTAMAPAGPAPSPREEYRVLQDGHLELCRMLQEQEETGRQLESDLEASQLSCAALRSAREFWAASMQTAVDAEAEPQGQRMDECHLSDEEAAAASCEEAEADAEAECRRLEAEVAACEQALAQSSNGESIPPWARRCAWRGELDIRAGQLERISMQFDTTKRSLDAANEELQWQATSAEALRMRLAEVLRAAKVEEAKAREFRAEQEQSEGAIRELLEHWSEASAAGGPLPLACHQARWLLEKFHNGEAREEQAALASALTKSPPRGLAAGAAGLGAAPPGPGRAAPARMPAAALPTPLPPVLTWTTAGLLGT